MYKVLLIVFGATCFFIEALSQTSLPPNAIITNDVYVVDINGNVVKTDKPVFKFEHSTYDFGQLIPTGKVSHDFVFTNIGKQPLIISEVKNACYCISSHWDSKPIMPGQQGVITVFYDTTLKKGKFRTGVSIFSNAYSYPAERLFVEGKIVEQIAATIDSTQTILTPQILPTNTIIAKETSQPALQEPTSPNNNIDIISSPNEKP